MVKKNVCFCHLFSAPLCLWSLLIFYYRIVQSCIGEECLGTENTPEYTPTLADSCILEYCQVWTLGHRSVLYRMGFGNWCHPQPQSHTPSCYWPAFGIQWREGVWCWGPIIVRLCWLGGANQEKKARSLSWQMPLDDMGKGKFIVIYEAENTLLNSKADEACPIKV